MKILVNKLDIEIEGLKLHNRNKRGIFNFVGTTYKYLFGILNEDDKEELEQKLADVKNTMLRSNELNKVINQVNDKLQEAKKLILLKNNENALYHLYLTIKEFIETM